MVRAITTGVPYSPLRLNLPLVAWEDLHEVGGIFVIEPETGEHLGQPGKTRSELAARFPQLTLAQAVGETAGGTGHMNRSSSRLQRAKRFVCDLLERHGGTDDRVAVVSHGGFYNLLLAELLGTRAEDGFWFNLNNTGITRFNFEEEGIGLAYANRLEHLPAELIT